jgi:hypothetical protein
MVEKWNIGYENQYSKIPLFQHPIELDFGNPADGRMTWPTDDQVFNVRTKIVGLTEVAYGFLAEFGSNPKNQCEKVPE